MKYPHIFDTAHIAQDLKNKTVKAGIYSFTAEVISQVLRLGSLVILARLLLPEHFGLVGMVTALTAFAERFKHLGLSTVTIQEKVITHEQVSTLFWINAGTGLCVALAITAASTAIASFYGEPRLVLVTVVLSLGFVVGGLSVQHEALLRRQLRFKALAYIQIVATLGSVALAVELAREGFTYWALVCREVSRPALLLMGAWMACGWWPGLPRRNSGTGSLLRVGRNILGADTLFFLSKSVDAVVLGKVSGAHALGLYKQASQLVALPISQLTTPVGSVALPSFSALQDQVDRYRRYFEKLVEVLFFVVAPLIAFMAIFSEDIVRVVLGEKWVEAAFLFKILAIGALVEPLFVICGTVMITQRRSKVLFSWVVLYAVCIVLGVVIGVQWGPTGVAIGYAVAHFALILPSLSISFRDTPVSMTLFFRAVFKPIGFSVVTAGVLLGASYGLATMHSVWRVCIGASIGALVYLALWMLHRGTRERLFDDVSSLSSVLKSQGALAK